ncbi:MAG: GxxExxY protein [Patescibacteria group bacterium]
MYKNKEGLLYPDLSYIILGILFEIQNKLGTKYQEKHYQNAFETKLKLLKILYKREVKLKINFEGETPGDFYADFIVENKILLEFKKVWQITIENVGQVLRYLDAANLRLGIIVNFRYKKLQYRRVAY